MKDLLDPENGVSEESLVKKRIRKRDARRILFFIHRKRELERAKEEERKREEEDMKKEAHDTIDKVFQENSSEGKIANAIRMNFDKQ